ncbi:MAG: glycosyltransferase family A protein [Candidatus Paceibacterota bacterium]
MILTIAFNNLEILEVQFEYLKKYLNDPFNYVIVDNSNKEEYSRRIEIFCSKNKISYIKIPKNPLTGLRASGSHGIALNWCYKNLIRKYSPKYFGFLDHDIFPLKKVSIIDKLEKSFYGAIRSRKDPYWYMWPGFSFFIYSKVKKYSFNFFPYHAGKDGSIFLDTGGSNYFSIFKKIGKESIRTAESKLINLFTEKEFVKGEDSSQTFEIIDGAWLHLRQIAWREESSNKMEDKEKIVSLAKRFLY